MDKIDYVDYCIQSISQGIDIEKAQDELLSMAEEDNFLLVSSRILLSIQQDPDNSYWHYLLSQIYEKREVFYDAIKELFACYKIDHHHACLAIIAGLYAKLGDFKRAEHYYRRSLVDNESDHEGHMQLGKVLISQLRYEAALKEFETCLLMRSEDVAAIRELSGVHRMLGNFDKARELAETAISIEPDNSENWMMLARVHEITGDESEMFRILEKLISLETAFGHDKVIALAMLNRTEEALSLIEQNWCLDGRSEHAAYYLDKAYILVKAGKLKEADQMLWKSMEYGMRDFGAILHQDTFACMKAIEDLEINVKIWRADAVNEFIEKNRVFEESVEDVCDDVMYSEYESENEVEHIERLAFERLGEEDFGQAAMLFHDAYLSSGSLFYAEQEFYAWDLYGDIEKSLSVIENAIVSFPDEMDLNYARGYALYLIRRYDEAVKVFRQCVECIPEVDGSREMLAFVLNRMGRHEEALEVVEEAIASYPDILYYHFEKAVALHRLGRVEEALPEWEIASTIPLDEYCGIDQCWALLRLGEVEKCREGIKTRISKVENDPPEPKSSVWIDAAAIYAQMGDEKEAMHWLEKTLTSSCQCWYKMILYQFDYEELRNLPGAMDMINRHKAALEAKLAKGV